jgi:hypothetical protein
VSGGEIDGEMSTYGVEDLRSGDGMGLILEVEHDLGVIFLHA